LSRAAKNVPAHPDRLAGLLVLLLPAAALPACVIPLAPDFQDPPAQQNFVPQLLATSPDQGSVVNTRTFRITVTDPNPGDSLWIRWYADFPPSQAATRVVFADFGIIPARPDGTVQTTTLDATADCQGDSLLPGIPAHTITVVVSDRDFGPSGAVTPFDGNHEVTASWSLLLQCPTPTAP
jgi:hypothetical protein